MIQANQVWEDRKANYKNYLKLLGEISEETDLIVLPEMFDTGFSMNVSLAEAWETGEGIIFLKELARHYNAAVYTSIMTIENNEYYNRGVFVYPDGSLLKYDKRKAFGLGGEDQYFRSGNSEQIVEYMGWKINLQICYDLRFPEIARNRIDSQGNPAYDLILYVANWPAKRSLHWRTLLRARAIENQSYVVGVNRIGTDGLGLSYSGDSVSIDLLGVENHCESGRELVKTVLLSKDDLIKHREMLPFLKDR